MKIFHGSTVCVEKPLATACRELLDFGKGFYVTNLQEQAERWAIRVAGTRKASTAWLNVYQLDIEEAYDNYNCLTFKAYNEEWLDFIIDSRNGGTRWKAFDLIEGGIANDRVFDSIELYLANLLSRQEALGRLAAHQPNNQFCLISQQLIDQCLHFEEAIFIDVHYQKGGSHG